mmetsp:Transcript_24343/g.36784  ORF Transcript_24343/g.36784 Transcript_24343/m.36784 type:complete len:504 (-) Transcript_24343:85-1596(-)|eukprot:CAMPEP_0194205404 /NCGR_PEP_ID=MMETSP0156-20130528/4682_1 /TAXON_ID=33649 /ORGANISM="Thalassionema nitzschioides, Strain L26-B" /LENGTH=503 /DNA_ID=CAMNT_0038931665 /DNA_START=190 /DNA_END=1701 /DNA_ORIENTATION=+
MYYQEEAAVVEAAAETWSLPDQNWSADKTYIILISKAVVQTITISYAGKFCLHGLTLPQVSRHINNLPNRIRHIELLRWNDATAAIWLLSTLSYGIKSVILNECKFSCTIDLSSIFRSGNLNNFGYMQSELSPLVANPIFDQMVLSPHHLTQLNLSFNPLGDEMIQRIASNIIPHLCLQDLQVIGCGITDIGAKALAKAIRSSTSLTKLSLSDNLINDDGVAALCNSIIVTNTVSELEIGYNSYGADGFAAIAETLLRSPISKLYTHGQILSSPQSSLPGVFPEMLWKAIEHTKSLKELNLSCNHIGNIGAASIAQILQINTSIQILYISNTRIGDAGMALIAQALKDSKTQLRQIKLAFNSFHDDGLLHIAKALEGEASRVERIDLGGVLCHQSSTIQKLTKSLKRNKSLKEFICQVSSNCCYSEEDNNILASFLKLEFDYLRSSKLQRLFRDEYLKRLPLIFCHFLSGKQREFGIDLVYHTLRNKPGISYAQGICRQIRNS